MQSGYSHWDPIDSCSPEGDAEGEAEGDTKGVVCTPGSSVAHSANKKISKLIIVLPEYQVFGYI